MGKGRAGLAEEIRRQGLGREDWAIDPQPAPIGLEQVDAGGLVKQVGIGVAAGLSRADGACAPPSR
jgi:hypothetical protein